MRRLEVSNGAHSFTGAIRVFLPHDVEPDRCCQVGTPSWVFSVFLAVDFSSEEARFCSCLELADALPLSSLFPCEFLPRGVAGLFHFPLLFSSPSIAGISFRLLISSFLV